MSRVRTGREWVVEVDPETLLTPYQRQVLHTVRAYGGNRSRASKALGRSKAAVGHCLISIARRGVVIPPPVGPHVRMTERRRVVIAAVERHGGNRAAAARELGVTTTAVHDALKDARLAGVEVPATYRGWSRQRRSDAA
jgi:DNA-binding NtrC family response regulator